MARLNGSPEMRPVPGLAREAPQVSGSAAAARGQAARQGASSGPVQWGQFQGSTIKFDPSGPPHRVSWSGPKAQRPAPGRPTPRPPPPQRQRARGPQNLAAPDSSDLDMFDSDDDNEATVNGSARSGYVPSSAQQGRDGADSSNDDGRDQAVRTFRRRHGVAQADAVALQTDDWPRRDDDETGRLLRAVGPDRGGAGLRRSVLQELAQRLRGAPMPADAVPGGLGLVRAQLIAAVQQGRHDPKAGADARDLNCLLPLLMLGLQRRRPPSLQMLAAARAQMMATPPRADLPPLRPQRFDKGAAS